VTRVVRLEEKSQFFLDFYLFPNMNHPRTFYISLHDPWLKPEEPIADFSVFNDVGSKMRSTKRELLLRDATGRRGDFAGSAPIVN